MKDHQSVASDPERFGLRVVDGTLFVEGVSLREIASEVGTPVFVYGAAHIEGRYRELAQALAGSESLLCYAVKANSSQAILRLLARLGAGADIVSGGELERALAAGIPADRIVFSGVGKQTWEIDAALRAGIRSINAESAEELEQLRARGRELGIEVPVSLRINPDVDPETHPYLATGLREAKFGIVFDQGLELALSAHEAPELRLVGIACHIGSQITEARPFLDSLARLKELIGQLRERGVALEQVDLGGGMGIPYDFEASQMDPASWGRAILEATKDLDLRLVLEPGRYLVGNAGVLLTRVLIRKRGEEKNFVVVDAAMNDLIRPALYEAEHLIVPVSLPAAEAELRVADIVGPVCECGDFLAQDREIPWPETGDVLAVLSAGAYAMTMASTYNTRPLAPEVMVSGSRWAITRPRGTVEALIAQERYPDWLE